MNGSRLLRTVTALVSSVAGASAALATVPPPPPLTQAVPALGPAGVGALVALLGVAGFVVMRRRRK